MLSLSLFLTGAASAALPLTSSEWLPILTPDSPLVDAVESPTSRSHLEIVGDSDHVAGHWSMDASTFYVRMRLASSPSELTPLPYACGVFYCQWGVLIDTDGDLATFERALVLSDGAASLQIRTDPDGAGWAANTETVLYEETAPLSPAMVQSVAAPSSVGGDTDAFLEFAIPRVWFDLSTSDATVRIALATGMGRDGDGFSLDLATPLSTDVLESAWSIPVGLDGDGDGLLLSEERTLGSDPQDADSDDDGLTDREERDLGTSPIHADTDEDGLNDFDEIESYSTDPLDADSDDDGLSDGDEVLIYDTDPSDPLDPDPTLDDDCDGLSDEVDPLIDGSVDPDEDGLSNEIEWECGSDPCVFELDVDGDGVSNIDELFYGTDPCNGEDPDITLDADCDGIADYADDLIEPANDDMDEDGVSNDDEIVCGTDPCSAEEDHDNDGIATADELNQWNTDPCDAGNPDPSIDDDCDGIEDYRDELIDFDPIADNDDDGIPNGHEIDACDLDPCIADDDPDRDGVSNIQEATCGTDPCNPDSDADGLWDGDELSDSDCTDDDDDGVIDALDPDAPASPDPTQPERGSYGFTGGAFTGGSCASSAGSPAALLAVLGLLVVWARRRPIPCAAILLMGVHTAPAHSKSINADRFEPVPHSSGFTGLMDATPTPTLWTAAMWLHHANQPLQYRYDDPKKAPLHLVKSLWSTTAQLGVHHKGWHGDIAVPTHIFVHANGEPMWMRSGDARISGGRTLRKRTANTTGLAITAHATVPTGDEGAWLGHSGPRAGATAHVSHGRRTIVAASSGLEAGAIEELPGLTLGPSLHWRTGASTPVHDAHRLSIEVDANHPLLSLSVTGANAVEASTNWHWLLTSGWTTTAGVGTALTRGIGSPRYRMFVGIRHAPNATEEATRDAPVQPPQPVAPASTVPQERVVHIAVTDSDLQPLLARIEMTDQTPGPLANTNEDGIATLSVPINTPSIRVVADGYAPLQYVFDENVESSTTISVQLNPTRVYVEDERIRIEDKIFFQTGKSDIDPISYQLLDEVALVLLDHPEVHHVEIQGHTDSLGSDQDNIDLSLARAQAVMNHLVNAGIAPSRLSAKGLGESTPIDDSDTDSARAMNRRVEFHIKQAP